MRVDVNIVRGLEIKCAMMQIELSMSLCIKFDRFTGLPDCKQSATNGNSSIKYALDIK